MPGEAFLIQEEDVRGRHTHVPGADLAPLEPHLQLAFGLRGEVAEGFVPIAGDYDRVVAVVGPDLLQRLSEIHLDYRLRAMPSRCSAIALCAASSSWRRTASRMRRLPSREISDRSTDRNNRACESSSSLSMTSMTRSTTVLCVALARRSWNSASSSAPEWPLATRSC